MNDPSDSKENAEKNNDDAKKEEAMKKIVGGGSALMIFGLLGGLLGWAFNALFSRSDIGVGPGWFAIVAASAAVASGLAWVSAGFHNAISKYVSAALVTSKENASKYASAGSFIMNCFGAIIFGIFMIIGIIFFPINYFFTIIFFVSGISLYFLFIRDIYIGNLGGLQRFDKIGFINFANVFGIVISIIGWLFFQVPLNIVLIAAGGLVFGNFIQILIARYFFNKDTAYEFKFFTKSNKKERNEIFKYGLYCAVPMLVLMGTIYSISTIYYTFFLGANSELVGVYGMLVGYASIMGSSVVFGWPQVPAISEAKAKKDDEMINHIVRNAFKMGFNFSMFFLCLYACMAYSMMLMFHGPEYVIGTVPLIIHSLANVIIGLDFLACTILIGIGDGKKAGIIIAILSLSVLIIVPILIPIMPQNMVLLVGPLTLLIVALALLPTCYKYILKHTTNPNSLYVNILWKSGVSAGLSIVISWTIQFFFLPGYESFLHFIGAAAIGLGLFVVFMLLLGGFDEEDFKMVEGIPLMKPLANALKKINRKSPFYKENQ